MKSSWILTTPCHPWNFIEQVAEKCIQTSTLQTKVTTDCAYSRLNLCQTFRLDDDYRILSAEELLLRTVHEINASHDGCSDTLSKYDRHQAANRDVKFRTLICTGLNEQCLHLWLECFCCATSALQRWYQPTAFLRNPVWMQIKCEMRILSYFPFTLKHTYELHFDKRRNADDFEVKSTIDENVINQCAPKHPLRDSVRDLLVRYHLFSWELQG